MMNAYRSSPVRSEPLVSQRAPLRVYVGIAAIVVLFGGGAAWVGLAFGGWALLTEVPTLLLMLVGFIVQIRRNGDPRSIAEYRAYTDRLADAWLASGNRRPGGPWFRV